MMEHFERVAEAFTQKAEIYDEFGRGHPNLERMRGRVYEHVLRFAKPKARILEINAGTGGDALFLARRGYIVHATDISPGMVAAIQSKIEDQGMQGKLTAEHRSYTKLSDLESAPFDYIFSNFGGLNCIQDLGRVTRQLPHLLQPGGRLTWVIMPPVCPWELILVFQGNPGQAFRRLREGGTLANVEGYQFQVWYYTPGRVMQILGNKFHLLRLEGLSIFAPPADRKQFAHRYPGAYSLLAALDERVAAWPVINGMGDFFILSMEYMP